MPRTAHRVSLIERVTEVLDRAKASYAVIGAAAMAARGVGRSTRDVDLLTLSVAGLDKAWWTSLSRAGVSVSVSHGDADDPLAGVVRFERNSTNTLAQMPGCRDLMNGEKGERPVDLVFGRYRWQQRVLARAQPAAIGGLNLPTVQTSDLILLKLYAGGAQDAWDIEQLLAGPDRGVLIADVEAVVAELPARCRRLWKAVLDPRP